MADKLPLDYKTLYLNLQGQREEERRAAEERVQAAEKRQKQAEEGTQKTTFDEYLRACHNSLSLPLRIGNPVRSTKGKIQPPTRKYCPLRFREWTRFPIKLARIYQSVCGFLQPSNDDAPRLFSPLIALEELGRRVRERPLSSEKDLENYERLAVEDHVGDVIRALSGIPSARSYFEPGDEVQFDNHPNALDEETDQSNQHGRPDQFCIHRQRTTSTAENSTTLLMTVEYKPPHKLSKENLVVGLRPIDFWDEVVQRNPVPTGRPGELREGESQAEAEERAKGEKLEYNAARLAGSAIVQEYHVMIEKGLAYSYVSTGEAFVFLYVPKQEPETLYYHLCVPNKDFESMRELAVTAVARVLCFCLMSYHRRPRSQSWRRDAMNNARIWPTSLNHVLLEISDEELQQTPPGSEYTPSSPIEPSLIESHRETRSQTRPNTQALIQPGSPPHKRSPSPCSSSTSVFGDDSANSSDSDLNQTSQGRKRSFSQIRSSPPQPRKSGTGHIQSVQGTRRRRPVFGFCTQKCLLGLQQGVALDENCPNVSLHRKGLECKRHMIGVQDLVQLLKQQLAEDLDHFCDPWGECGAYGAPFKITSADYGYTVIGKGTTSRLWGEVSKEATVYQHLQKAQASAVPVFLGSIDLTCTYFHEAGQIQHMLLMAWGGEAIHEAQVPRLNDEIQRSKREISNLGIIHGDWRDRNLLWNAELGRILVIDFHRYIRKPADKRVNLLKRGIDYHKTAPQAKRYKKAVIQTHVL